MSLSIFSKYNNSILFNIVNLAAAQRVTVSSVHEDLKKCVIVYVCALLFCSMALYIIVDAE